MRVAKGLIAGVVCVQFAGCLALSLSSRGAPEDEWLRFERKLDAVDLPMDHDGGHEEAQATLRLWTTIPATGWLHGYEIELLDATGEVVPPEVLHHFKVMLPERRELFSPVMLHLAGGGGEIKPVRLPRQAGVPLEQGDSLLVTAMLHNPTSQHLDGVQLTVRLYYSTQGPWEAPLEVVPFFTHVTPPMHNPAYDLPPGISQRSLDISPVVSGWLIGLGGHLHQYGVLLRLEDVTEERVLWEKKPKRSDDGGILEVPYDRFVWSKGPALRPDHIYRVTAVYNNPTGEIIPDGGMGTVGGAFVPEEPWPVVDRQAEEYVWYLNHEIEGIPHQNR